MTILHLLAAHTHFTSHKYCIMSLDSYTVYFHISFIVKKMIACNLVQLSVNAFNIECKIKEGKIHLWNFPNHRIINQHIHRNKTQQ